MYIINKEAFEYDWSKFDFAIDEDIHNCEDTLFNVQYIKKCPKVILGPEVHYDYIQSDSSVTHSKYSYKFHSGLCAWVFIVKYKCS